MGLKVIVDVDTGIDDATAVMLLLSQPDVEVLAVTCVKGYFGLDHVCRNTLRVLKACGRPDIPVYQGAEQFLLPVEKHAPQDHVTDGMGDVDWSESESVEMSSIQSEHAVTAIIHLINQFPGEITFVALAPLTNIAIALRVDPSISSKLKEVYIMGGNIEGQGNVSPCAEYNFYCDPEAAEICLHGFNIPVSILTWEVCLRIQNILNLSSFDEWICLGTPKSNFFKRITNHIIERVKLRQWNPGPRFCDLFCMVAVVDRSAILEEVKVHADIELHGQRTRGQMICDWKNRLGNKPNVTIIKKICVDKVNQYIAKMLE